MSVPGLQWLLELVVAGFSAVAGAAALLLLQTYLRRGRYLRALQNELELNRNRLDEQVRRFENIENQTSFKQFPRYLSGVFEAIRVNDPMLFLVLQREIPIFDSIYQRLNDLNGLTEPGVSSQSSKEELLDHHTDLRSAVDFALDVVRDKRADNLLYRHIGNPDDSLVVERVVIGEDGRPIEDTD